jgi:hypothetical protein
MVEEEGEGRRRRRRRRTKPLGPLPQFVGTDSGGNFR